MIVSTVFMSFFLGFLSCKEGKKKNWDWRKGHKKINCGGARHVQDFWKNLYKLVTRWSGGGEQHRRVFDLEPDLNLGEPGALLGLDRVGGSTERADLNEQALAKTRARGRSASIGPM